MIEFFASPSGDPSGFGEGETFLGSLSVGGPGSFSINSLLPVAIGQVITATATDNSGNSSEFSNICPVIAGSGGAAGIPVTTTADSGPGSLREAINIANGSPGSTIVFKIPTSDPGFGGGVFTIRPTSTLPDLSANGTIIDGTTQQLFTGDTNAAGPEVVLNGSLAGGGVDGLTLAGQNQVVRGLVVNGFVNGIHITGTGATGNIVQGNFIGINSAGAGSLPNTQNGILIDNGAQNNTVGGNVAGARNIISGNTAAGVLISGANTNANSVQGNFIKGEPNGFSCHTKLRRCAIR